MNRKVFEFYCLLINVIVCNSCSILEMFFFIFFFRECFIFLILLVIWVKIKERFSGRCNVLFGKIKYL